MDRLTGQGSTGLHTLLPTAPAEAGVPKLLHHCRIHHFDWDSKGAWGLLASLALLLASPYGSSAFPIPWWLSYKPYFMVTGLNVRSFTKPPLQPFLHLP